MALQESLPPNFSENDDCALCFEPISIRSTNEGDEDDGGDSIIMIDDVHLMCGTNRDPRHHFHWSCLQEYDQSEQWDRSTCPCCNGNTLDEQGRLIVTVRNEGGVTYGFDLGEAFDEERVDETRPLSWKKERAFLSALQFNELEDAETFLREGVNPNAHYEDGHLTALHMAALRNDVAAGRLLLRYSADPNILTDTGDTALQIAQKSGFTKFVHLLEGMAGGER